MNIHGKAVLRPKRPPLEVQFCLQLLRSFNYEWVDNDGRLRTDGRDPVAALAERGYTVPDAVARQLLDIVDTPSPWRSLLTG